METSVESLEDSRVRLTVQIPAADFEGAVDDAFKKLAAEIKLPGFRPGKAPRKLLEQRIGTGAAREQAMRDALPRYYAEAVLAANVDAIAPPEIEILAGEEEGDVSFEAVVQVRPTIKIDGYRGLRAVIPDPGVTDEEVAAQIDLLREQFADLEDSPNPLTDGDYAQIDLKGSVGDELVEGLSASDFLYEVGSGQLLPKLDDELRGQKPGAILTFTEELPAAFGERAGQEASFSVLVKEAKRKVLPELTDEWVQDASEFETVAELEADVLRRMETIRKVQAQIALRDKLLDQLADLVQDEAPEPLVEEDVQRRVHDLAHRLSERGASVEQYLASVGQSAEEFIARVREASARAVKADLALRAIVAQEDIQAGDDELTTELERLAERVERPLDEVRSELEHGGGLEAVRSEVARGKALQLVVDHATVVDDAGNEIDLTLPAPPEEPAEETAAESGEHEEGAGA